MNRDKITELLRNYRAYKQAIYNYEQHKPRPSAGVANYSGMPGGDGAPELFFAPVGRMADYGLTSALDHFDHAMYTATVHVIERTVNEVLDDNERYVITQKWLERNTMELHKIAIIKEKDESTIRRWHKNALRKLSISFSGMYRVPEIEEIPQKVV